MLVIRSAVEARFQSSQSPTESHKALSIALKKVHDAALATHDGYDDFLSSFSRCVDRVLVLPRTDTTAKRVVEFISQYMRALFGENAEESTDNAIPHEYREFIDDLVDRYTQYTNHKLPSVRFHCLHIVSLLLEYCELSDESFDDILQRFGERLQDADTNVRKEAALRLCLLEGTPETNKALLWSMQHDPSSEVRLTIAYNISHEEGMLEHVLERIRDTSPSIRRAIYRKILMSFRMSHLNIKTRVKIVTLGLTDSNEGVQAAAKALLGTWINDNDLDVSQVLQALDPVVNTEAADLVLNAFLQMRPDLVERMAFPRDKRRELEPEDMGFDFTDQFFEDILPHDVLMLRGFQEFCIRNRKTAELESGMPELYALATNIELLAQKQWNPEQVTLPDDMDMEEWHEEATFMIEQLLWVASRYDLDDEAGRQKITVVTSDIVSHPQAPSNKIIEHVVTIQRRLNASSDTSFVSWAFETLNSLPPSAASQEGMSQDTSVVVTDMLRSVVLFKYVLALVSSRDVSVYLPSLYEEYISTPLHSPILEIKIHALECLALGCLLDDKFAEQHFTTLWTTAKQALVTLEAPNNDESFDDDELLIQKLSVGISGISDVVLNSTSSFDSVDMSRCNLGSADAAAEAKNANTDPISILAESVTDNSSRRGSVDCDTDDQTDSAQGPKFPYIYLKDIVDLLIQLLYSKSCKVQNLAAFNLSKLVLSGRIDEEEMAVKELLTLYFRNERRQAENDSIGLSQQQISLFLRAYTKSDLGKITIASLFRTVCESFLEIKAAEKLNITLGDIFIHLLELTTPDETRPLVDGVPDTISAHVVIASNLLEWIFTTDNATQRRSAAHALNNVVLKQTSPESIAELIATIDAHEEVLSQKTAVLRNMVHKFRERLDILDKQYAEHTRKHAVLLTAALSPQLSDIQTPPTISVLASTPPQEPVPLPETMQVIDEDRVSSVENIPNPINNSDAKSHSNIRDFSDSSSDDSSSDDSSSDGSSSDDSSSGDSSSCDSSSEESDSSDNGQPVDGLAANCDTNTREGDDINSSDDSSDLESESSDDSMDTSIGV